MRKYYENLWKKGGYPFEKIFFLNYEAEQIKKIIVASHKKILDLGCGNGRIGALFVGDNEVFGMDFSETAVAEAKTRGIRAQAGDICSRLPFDDDTFDIIMLIEIMEHVYDPVFVLREAYRVLKKGGTLLCTFPNAGNFINRLHFFLTGNFKDYTARFNLLYPEYPFTEHIRVFCPKLMEAMLKDCNFRICLSEFWFPYSFESRFFNKINFLAKLICYLRLEKAFPNSISVAALYKCQK
jgi:methionine biosynthesis protein MetW